MRDGHPDRCPNRHPSGPRPCSPAAASPPPAPGSEGSRLIPKDSTEPLYGGGHGQGRCCQESTESIAATSLRASPLLRPHHGPARGTGRHKSSNSRSPHPKKNKKSYLGLVQKREQVSLATLGLAQ